MATLCVISEQTPTAPRRTPQGRRQAESRHSRKGERLQNLGGYHFIANACGNTYGNAYGNAYGIKSTPAGGISAPTYGII